MINSNSDFTSRRLKSLSTGAVTKIGFVPNIQTKKDKPEETPKLKSYSNPYEEFIKTWEPGDVIPIIAPGKSLHLCKYTKSLLNVDSSYYSSTHRHENQKKFKNAEFSDMEYKVLGRKLKDNLQSLLSRAAGARGLWVDDKNKIRCPPGSPAANQFTDITGSNCLIPTPRTAAGSGARAIRKATNTAQQLAGETGQRFDARSKPNLATANAQELVDQGLDVVGQAMGFGGRIVTTQEMVDGGLVGSMRVFPKRKLNIVPTAGFAPKNRKRNAPDTDTDVILLGLKEQIWRGRRTTELAAAARERLKNPLTPNGLKLPDGSFVGDIVGSKASFVNALTQLFPNVPVPEIEELYDQAIPRILNKLERKKLKRALEQFWLSTIADIIQDPEKGKWVTIMKIDNKMDSAVEIKLDHFAPSGSAGGRRISQAAQALAAKKGAYETGGVHVEFKLNPFELYRNIDGSDNGFDRNGRALGVPDSPEGTMHYIATHELGHLSHFAGVMKNLGFDTANLQRYGNVQRLVVPKGQAGPEWQRENNVNAWMIDFRQAKNPMGSRSIQLMIDSANNLNNRQYVRTGNWGNVSGYTRSDLESDLDNFMNSFIYAVNTNITDNQSDRDLMNEFTTGVYATMNTLELRAEYYASRRLFSDPANASVNPFDTFATTLSSAANATQTAKGIKQQLIAADDKIYGVKPGNWNLSGKMSATSLSPRPSAKTQRVRRAVDSDGQRNTNRSSRTLSGAMKSPGLQPRTTSGRSWKEQDTISTPSTNMPQSQDRSSIPMMIQSSMESFAPQNTLTGRMSSGTNSSPDKVGNIKVKDGVPQYPRTPTYGPMLGDFNNLFQGVSSWEDFKRIYDDQEVTFLDYETTGIIFDKYGRVLDNGSPTQIGAVKIKNGEVVDRFNIFVNPGKPLQPWSLKNLKDVDGNPLTDAYLKTQMSLEEAHKMFTEFAGPNALMGVQNAAYDKNVLDDALRAAGLDWSPRGWIDLKDMSGMVLPRYSESNPDGPYRFDKEKQKNVPSNGLADITKYLEVDLGKDHHNADKDAEATAESMRRLINGAIEKNWSPDVFDEKKRKDFVQQTQNQFDSDVKEWEPLFSQHLAEGMTGKMSSSNPILQRAPVFGSGNESNYYNNVSKSSSWKPGALAATEPKRLADRLSAVQEIKKFVNTGNSDSKNNLFSDLNGLDSSFLDYLKSKDETEIMSDLRQAAIEFHSGIDRKVRLNIESSKVMEALQNGIVRKKKKTSLPGLEDRKKEYETDIGIPSDIPEELRPITGYVVHSDTDFSDSEESFKSFVSRTGGDSDRYTFDAYNSDYNNKKGYNNVFGDAEIILNEDVAERTSYGNGDLLDNNVYPVLMDSYNSDIIGRALIDSVGRTDNRATNMIELLYGKYNNNYDTYRKDNGKTKPKIAGVWENRDALIFGGIKPSDIFEVRIPFESIDSSNSISADDFINKPRDVLPYSPQRIFPLSKDEQKMLVDILSGVPPMDAAPKNIGIRVNDINSYSKLSKDFKNYRILQEANRLQEAASAAGVKLVVTNDFGLDIFAARAFDARAAKNNESLTAVDAKIEKQIKELIDALRAAAANLRKDSDK